ncbi:unnamed protein product, partial [Ectocarpus sp. 6 AP-2014]
VCGGVLTAPKKFGRLGPRIKNGTKTYDDPHFVLIPRRTSRARLHFFPEPHPCGITHHAEKIDVILHTLARVRAARFRARQSGDTTVGEGIHKVAKIWCLF